MRRAFALALLFVVGLSSLASAQAVTSGTGAINGRVTDSSDAVMPGVTVTITSPQQMGVRTIRDRRRWHLPFHRRDAR